jgi:hypothetical protein
MICDANLIRSKIGSLTVMTGARLRLPTVKLRFIPHSCTSMTPHALKYNFDVDAIEGTCGPLPNKSHWESYVRAFREGATPWIGSFPEDDERGTRPANANLSA